MTAVWLTCLFIIAFSYQGNAPLGAEQVSQFKAKQAGGKTLLMWQEVQPPATQESLLVSQLVKIRANLDQEKNVRYRIYRSQQPITSVKGLKHFAAVPHSTGWNADYYDLYPKPTDQALRNVVEEGQPPIPPRTGIYFHNPEAGGEAYYAVTLSINGRENVALTSENVLQTPTHETVGQGIFILQYITKPERFQYIDNPVLHYYVR